MPDFYEPDVLKHLQQVEMGIVKDFIRICEENKLTYFAYAGTGIGALRHKGYIPWDDDIDISMPRKDYDEFLRIVQEEMGNKYYVLNCDTCDNYPLATTRLCLKGTVFKEKVMKDVDCPWGIFLDLYALDNVADNWFLYWVQMWTAWFWGKLLILRIMPRPYLYIHGLAAKIVTGLCIATHHTMKFFRISPKWLLRRREKANTRYNHKETRRLGYFCDPLPYTNIFDKDKIYPLRMLEFEDITLPFPNNLEELLTKMYGNYMEMPPEDKRKTHYPEALEFGEY